MRILVEGVLERGRRSRLGVGRCARCGRRALGRRWRKDPEKGSEQGKEWANGKLQKICGDLQSADPRLDVARGGA